MIWLTFENNPCETKWLTTDIFGEIILISWLTLGGGSIISWREPSHFSMDWPRNIQRDALNVFCAEKSHIYFRMFLRQNNAFYRHFMCPVMEYIWSPQSTIYLSVAMIHVYILWTTLMAMSLFRLTSWCFLVSGRLARVAWTLPIRAPRGLIIMGHTKSPVMYSPFGIM